MVLVCVAVHHCVLLHCTVLLYIAQYCIVLSCIALHCVVSELNHNDKTHLQGLFLLGEGQLMVRRDDVVDQVSVVYLVYLIVGLWRGLCQSCINDESKFVQVFAFWYLHAHVEARVAGGHMDVFVQLPSVPISVVCLPTWVKSMMMKVIDHDDADDFVNHKQQ